MNILHETIQILTQPPGDLVYFLITLFALQQALIAALTLRQPAANLERWAWAIGAMLCGRVVLIGVALLGDAGILIPAAALPPLERLVEVISLLLLLWATLGYHPAAWQTWMLSILLALAGGFYFYALNAWLPLLQAGGAYNGTAHELIWEIAAIILLSSNLIVQFAARPLEWEWAVGWLIFWLLGHIAQLGWPVPSLHFSDWERLSALIAYPLLAAYLSRLQTSTTSTQPPPHQSVTPRDAFITSSETYISKLQSLLEKIETARELEPSLLIASSHLAHLFAADICAIALADNEQNPFLRIVARHPPTGELETPTIDLTKFPPLLEIWDKGAPKISQAAHPPLWQRTLHETLGYPTSGPLLVLPLCVQKKRIGLLLLGNPETKRPWATAELESYHLVASLVGGAINRAKQRGSSIFSLREHESEPLEDLAAAQQEIQALKGQIAKFKQGIREREQELSRLHQELEQSSAQTDEAALAFWQQEVQDLVNDREILIEERNHMGHRLTKMKRRLDEITDEHARVTQKLQQALTQKEELLAHPEQEANHQGIVGLLVANKDGEIYVADALARRLLALPAGDVIGMPLDSVYAEPLWTQAIDTLLTTTTDAPRRMHLSLQPQEEVVEAELLLLSGRDGQPDGLIVTLQSEKSLVGQQEAIAGIANELRTPMTSITGYTDLLIGEQVGILTELQQQFLERVKAGIEQMGQMLNDLVQITSPDARRIKLTPQPIDLIDVIEQGVMGLSARFRERDLTVELALPTELHPVQADRDSLYQIILRLLSNAAFCSSAGTGIMVSATEQESLLDGEKSSFIKISISDTGGGIAPEEHSKVFRRFYRAGQPLVQGLGERGVGMAVAKTLVEVNGGRIWVDSEKGIGSTFNFTLPTYQEDPPAAP